ncbi:MAG: hypothetical protein NT006_07960 [Candidatus Aminicenantes bacterium]|nr:hypothetical protein [Candidatus Aminicenantes bacterium]
MAQKSVPLLRRSWVSKISTMELESRTACQLSLSAGSLWMSQKFTVLSAATSG